MDKLPQVPAPRVTHVVSLAGVAIVVMPFLAYVGAPWGVYALVVAFWAGTVIAFTHNPTTGLAGENLLKAIQPELSQVDPDAEPQQKQHEDEQPLENRRRKEYEDNRGLFLGTTGSHLLRMGRKRTYEYSYLLTDIPMAARPR